MSLQLFVSFYEFSADSLLVLRVKQQRGQSEGASSGLPPFLISHSVHMGGVATGFSHSSSCEQNLHIFSLLAGRYFSNYFYYFFLSVMLRLKPRACCVLSKCSVLSYSACPQVTITFNFYI